jgi:predicted methyltransferase
MLDFTAGNFKRTLATVGLLSTVLIALPTLAHGHKSDEVHSTADMIKTAMKAASRPAKDVERDRNRKPVETLAFFGLEHDMKVVELIPGGGWYTRLIAPVVAESGEYYAALGTSRIERGLAQEDGFNDINIIAKDASMGRADGAKFYSLNVDSLGVTNVDMVFTFRNYHNFDEAGRAKMNEVAFAALKSGGIYAVVDHTARHMEGYTDSNRRRFDPVKAIKEIQAAGFVLVDFSDLHHREDDELEYEVGARSVTGNTDRWTLKFKKP